MVAQVSQFGDQALVNTLSGAAPMVAAASGSAPTFIPGTVFYNTTTSAFQAYTVTGVNNGWSVGNPQLRYLALLTADPVAAGVVNLSDAGFIECATAGYGRLPITFSNASAIYPSTCSNNSVLTFTMSSTMTVPVGWAALVTASTAGSSAGLFLASWVLAQAYQVNASQSIQVGIGQLTLQGN